MNGPRDNRPLYIDVSTFGAHAQACAQYLSKGRQVAFAGRLVYKAANRSSKFTY